VRTSNVTTHCIGVVSEASQQNASDVDDVDDLGVVVGMGGDPATSSVSAPYSTSSRSASAAGPCMVALGEATSPAAVISHQGPLPRPLLLVLSVDKTRSEFKRGLPPCCFQCCSAAAASEASAASFVSASGSRRICATRQQEHIGAKECRGD